MRFKTIFSPGRWVRTIGNYDGQIRQVKLVKLAGRKPICLIPIDYVWHEFRVWRGHRVCSMLVTNQEESTTARGFSPCCLNKNADTFQKFNSGTDWGLRRTPKSWSDNKSRVLPSRMSSFLTRRVRVIIYQDIRAEGKKIKSKLK